MIGKRLALALSAAILMIGAVAAGVAIAQSSFNLNAPVSFPVDI